MASPYSLPAIRVTWPIRAIHSAIRLNCRWSDWSRRFRHAILRYRRPRPHGGRHRSVIHRRSSLDDPMFAYMITPGDGLGADNGGGWSVQASQKIPWAGKRGLRGYAALAEADAMQGDIGETRLRLDKAARTAFYNYYLAARLLEVNTLTRRLLDQYRDVALNKYQLNQATEQDVLLADVELANLENRRTELQRDEQIEIARINTLLHRAADYPLPPPPVNAPIAEYLPNADALQQAAAQSRPDLYAMQSRIRAEEANLSLAVQGILPRRELTAKYDGFMPENMRPALGMEINVPVRNDRRSAAVREATDRLCQRRAEYQERLDQVRYEVQSAMAQAEQSRRVVQLYEERIIPAAERSLDSAQANYSSGKLDFLRLLDAERQLNAQREMRYQAVAEYHKRLAEMERSTGGYVPYTAAGIDSMAAPVAERRLAAKGE